MAWARAHCWSGVWLVLAASLSCAPAAQAQVAELGVRLGVSAEGTRVVIDSGSAISASEASAQAHERIFRLDGVDVPTPLHGDGQGLVKDWRLEAGEGGARLVLNVAGEAVVAHRFAIPASAGRTPFRYVIDLAAPAPQRASDTTMDAPHRRRTTMHRPTDATTLDARAVIEPDSAGAADGAQTLAGASPSYARPLAVASHRPVRSRATTLRTVRHVVVIDAGHGGRDPGAQSPDANEKDITLAAALALRERLDRSGRYRVVMTRTSDVFIPLEERVRIARRAGAELFIALHADSAGTDARAHGASVYTLSDHGETRVSEVLDGREWFRHAAARSDAAVGGILLDLTQRNTLNRSSIFAQMLIDRLSDRIDLLPNSHRDAGYFVLLAPDVPAVLLEMGFTTCPADEARLTDPVQRRQMINAVGDAIDAYFADEVRVAAN